MEGFGRNRGYSFCFRKVYNFIRYFRCNEIKVNLMLVFFVFMGCWVYRFGVSFLLIIFFLVLLFLVIILFFRSILRMVAVFII